MGRLIDADELKKLIIKKLGIASEEFLLESEKAVFEEIDKAPTVEAEPVRHSIWIKRRFDMATCSCCGDRWGSTSIMKYCPSCGAKMNAQEKEE